MSVELDNCEGSLALVERRIAECEKALCDIPVTASDRRLESDMDEGDIGFCVVSGLLCAVFSTNEAVAKWLEGVHDAASGGGGRFDMVQKLVGGILNHEGDNIDLFGGKGNFVTRDGENAYPLFHRLLFGHDILSNGGDGFINDNPFILMMEQKGKRIPGIIQAVRHLLADTMSKQGLPLPGSSFLDTTRDNGKPWNKIIDWSQDLAVRAYGDKRKAEELYEHVFTVRFQDAAGSGLIEVLNVAYGRARSISDEIRLAQIRLLSVAIAFFVEAAIGACRQNGVPYINNPMLPQLAQAYFALVGKSALETAMLHRETVEALREGGEAVSEHEKLERRISLLASGDENRIAVSGSTSALVAFLEEG